MNPPPPPRPLAEVVVGLTADADPYLSCDECFDRICAYVEQIAANPDVEDVAMRRHLDTCGACAEESATLLELGALDMTQERASPSDRASSSAQPSSRTL